MKKKKKGLLRLIFGRTAVVVVLLVLQLLVLFGAFRFLGEYMVYVFGGFIGLSAVVTIYILNEKSDPSFKMVWMILVLMVPVFGSLLYLFVQLQIGTKFIAKRLHILSGQTEAYIRQQEHIKNSLWEEDRQISHLAGYMKDYGGFPVYGNTSVTYFPLGEDKFEEMKRQLGAAKHFIFMEYFIVEEGVMWGQILDILRQKAKEGVEVRFLYDGMCCMMLLPYSYPKTLQAMGIQCKMFSPIKPVLSTHQNNRDHRKILVIDGHTAFTGGVNLADEYINQKVRFGHWKDTAIMLKGDAVRSFTIMFLQMWNIDVWKPEQYENYLLPLEKKPNPRLGYAMVYGDSPFDGENVGEQVYLNILHSARQYVHIMTPYLILDNEMSNSLCYAAKSGVETIIIMPHIPDKMSAYLLARTYYPELIEAGVKIYEYTPGFVHAKVFVSDDIKAVVGTINLDFRSLYLHFECAAFLYRNPAVADIEKDFQDTLKKCRPITLEDCKNYSLIKRGAGRILRLFAPLM